MTEETSSKSRLVPVRIERILGGREPIGMTPVPGEPLLNMMVQGPAAASEDRGRQPVPTTPVRPPSAPSPTPKSGNKK